MITIGIAGALSRIGTTTQALQLVQVLKGMEKKACYAEENEKKYLDRLAELYNRAEDKKNMIKFSNIEMYKPGYSDRVKDKTYDIMVRDFGNIDRKTFDRLKFEEQDIKIIVCGSKPSEIFKLEPLLRNSAYDDSYFVFSFVPPEDKISIMAMMGSRKNRCYFAGITLDPFVLNMESVTLYQKLLTQHLK